VISVSARAIEALKQFADPHSDAWLQTRLEPSLQGELRGILNHYLTNLLGRRFRMHAHLGELVSQRELRRAPRRHQG
jgi:hypothetical protein